MITRVKYLISVGNGTKELEALIAQHPNQTQKIHELSTAVSKLEYHIRAHLNFVENVPLALLAIAVAELNKVDSKTLHALLAVLFVGRIAHWWTLSNAKYNGSGIGRGIGVVTTHVSVLGAVIASVIKVYS
ncbi:membrane-associated, eicosanoid/glutathione metabolism protein [Obelidium mucronatum]|nr:membrane-associated, eicosanoid/glutathione metabolism protein [Obelidium mucronatum]